MLQNWLQLVVVISITWRATGSDDIAEDLCTTPNHATGDASSRAYKDPVIFGRSTVQSHPGHWPVNYCRITNVYLQSNTKTFYVGVDDISKVDACYGTRPIWNLKPKPVSTSRSDDLLRCDQVFDTGHVFTVYYYYGSNYFHVHSDTALPLYYTLYYRKIKDTKRKSHILMPSVEISRGQGTDWETNAFTNKSTYWNVLLELLAEPYKLFPLDSRLTSVEKVFCFKEVFFGMPRYDVEPDLVRSFSSFVKDRLHLRESPSKCHWERRQVGFIRRIGRRKILNEEHLRSRVQSFVDVDLVDFAELPFHKQVENVQKYDVLVGMNGAGLMNAVYLPQESVAVQLVPYEAQLNSEEYGKLLKARGKYLFWHNVHANLSQRIPGDIFNNSVDTMINVDEFYQLIMNALELWKS